jgi:methionyl-tRNA formyltransferase
LRLDIGAELKSARRTLMATFVVCTTKPWNVKAFGRYAPRLSGDWVLIDAPEELSVARLSELRPRYVFFPHWSWRVSSEIVDRFECVCFHMTDVPYGRGGSPLQNLIERGHRSTMLTALRMTKELDAGPVYLKRPLSLAGRAEEIFERAAELAFGMISEIATKSPEPQPQQGDAVYFPRRTPAQSVVPQAGTYESLCDFIRMLDAPTYPAAFIEWGDWRIEFDHAELDDDHVQARATIRSRKTT